MTVHHLQVTGVATKDAGVGKDGSEKSSFTPGIELLARQTLFAEGARGSCSEEVIEKFNLREGRDVQSYGENRLFVVCVCVCVSIFFLTMER